MIRADGVEIKYSFFPNKEIKLPEIEKAYIIEWYFESIEELFILQCIPKAKQCKLFMPYIPFSRMDRQVEEQFFTLPVFCGIINSMEFKEVIVLEAHSDVSVSMLDRVSNRHTSMSMFVRRADQYDAIVFPDAGAAKRYTALMEDNTMPVIVMNKKRDPQTGALNGFEILSRPEGFVMMGKRVCIVDDLSSYGGTFLGVATVLKQHRVNVIDLIVTHAEPAILRGNVLAAGTPINQVYCTDSLLKNIDTDLFMESLKRLNILDSKEALRYEI